MTRQQALFWWVVGSAALMVVGSFGPWAKVPGSTVSGIDGSNDGWFVVAIAVVAGAVFLWKRRKTQAGFAAIVGGVLGASVAMYDRSQPEGCSFRRRRARRARPGRLGLEPGDGRIDQPRNLRRRVAREVRGGTKLGVAGCRAGRTDRTDGARQRRRLRQVVTCRQGDHGHPRTDAARPALVGGPGGGPRSSELPGSGRSATQASSLFAALRRPRDQLRTGAEPSVAEPASCGWPG